MSDLPEYVIERSFAAPRALVWRAWTDPQLLHRWYGPGVETIIHQFDLQPGGVWLNEMKWGGNSNYSKMIFQEVVEEERIVWHHYSSTDAEWNVTTNPMMEHWPKLLLTTVTFSGGGQQTDVRLSQVPMDASDAEIEFFAANMANMDGGWGKGYTLVDEILAELQAE